MSTDYPGAIDTLTNPTGTDQLSSPSHAEQHANANDAIEAIETYAGRGVLGFASKTSDQASIGSSDTDISGLSSTVTVASGRSVRITVLARLAQVSSAGTITFRITDGSNTSLIATVDSCASGGTLTKTNIAIVSPTAGSKTYKARISTSAGTVTVNASASAPAFILVEDIGAA